MTANLSHVLVLDRNFKEPEFSRQYGIHPASMLFPMFSSEELEKLAQDIRERGLLEPIELYAGMVLDGRNRLEACMAAEIEPRFLELNVDVVTSPTHYVVSKNLHRRHLSSSQRAMIAAEMIPMLQEESKKREVLGKSQAINDLTLVPLGTRVCGKSTEIAARATGVGRGTVERALVAKRDHPELIERVTRGEISVHAASKGIDVPERELRSKNRKGGSKRGSHGFRKDKTAPFEPHTTRQRQVAESQKERMVVTLSTVNGLCRGLSELDVPVVASVCTQEELGTWAKKSRELANGLCVLATKLEKGRKVT